MQVAAKPKDRLDFPEGGPPQVGPDGWRKCVYSLLYLPRITISRYFWSRSIAMTV